jgi:hypothetical protein
MSRFGSLADISRCNRHVRFTPQKRTSDAAIEMYAKGQKRTLVHSHKTVAELSQRFETLEKTLGPEYLALLDGLQGILEDDLDAEVISAFASLDRLCTR